MSEETKYGGQCQCGAQIIKKDGGDWHCPECRPDILERAKDLRIKELEAEITAWIADRDSWIGRYEAVREEKDARIADQEAYIERLEAAFLKAVAAVLWDQVVVGGPKEGRAARHTESVQQKAREALERIRSGEKDD